MLGAGAYHTQAGLASQLYDSLGFVSFIQTDQSMDPDEANCLLTCTDNKIKHGDSKMDITQCVMLREAAILSVCTRSAQGVQVIESRSIVNVSYMKNFDRCASSCIYSLHCSVTWIRI